MGEVYRARDARLGRDVALKVLPEDFLEGEERKQRFEREARLLAALNHPGIAAIHSFEEISGRNVIEMELVEGDDLAVKISSGPLPLEEALSYARQIAEALEAAHRKGIVHRDLKPANVKVTPAGHVKLLDFGLAKLVEPAPAADLDSADSTASAAALVERTRQGTILGTAAYMSPEQAEGKPLDARSDVFSLGTVLWEMLAGRRPFVGDSYLGTLTAILRDTPPPLETVRPDVPRALARIVARALEKRPENRFPSAAEMEAELAVLGKSSAHPILRWPSLLAIAAAAALVFAAGGWQAMKAARVRHARSVTLPEISTLVEQQKFLAAVRLARDAERIVPEDVARLRRERWNLFSVRTEPPGAVVSFKPYLDTGAPWEPAGRTPIEEIRLPLAYYRWKFERDGFRTVELAAMNDPLSVRLDPESSAPQGMVRVRGGSFRLRSLDPVSLDDFWLDTYEVSNREYKAFVDAGGYSRREWWTVPFLRGGREIPFEEAMALFRDATGRPGPSTWELGAFQEGRADHPVEGVSWYEAAAYAAYAGKSLPTIYHWFRASSEDLFSEILSASNFSGKGAAARGAFAGLGPFGTYDMAGNVKEWCWNATGARRYALGGASGEVGYMYQDADAQDPLSRSAGYGFRCARTPSPPPAALLAPVGGLSRDYAKEKPVSDEVFRAYLGLYAYDKTPLDVKAEPTDDSSPYWRREKVSVLSAYGSERVPVFFFVPKNARPPYQTVVFFPHSGSRMVRSTAEMDMTVIDFVIRSGRALCYPVYRDTYERHVERTAPSGPNFRRDLVIQWSKDLGRALDWLETRPDVDPRRLAFYGVSLGANDGVTLLGAEGRFRTAVLVSGGFRQMRVPPEVDPVNFAPRVKIPVLLVAGKYDFQHPYETSQVPLVRSLGAPEKDKRHVTYEGGHVPPRIQPVIKEILDWLDERLGPVAPPGAPLP